MYAEHGRAGTGRLLELSEGQRGRETGSNVCDTGAKGDRGGQAGSLERRKWEGGVLNEADSPEAHKGDSATNGMA